MKSFPNKSPLKNRLNVVITSDMNYSVPGAVVVHSIDEAVEAVRDYADDDVYVIGGESIYRQMLPLCSTAHITKVDYAYQADAHFRILIRKRAGRLQRPATRELILISSMSL